MFYYERNRYLLLFKNFRWITLLLLLPALILAEIVAWSFILLRAREHWNEKWQAYHWVIKNWQGVMQERERIQRLRDKRDRDLLLQTTHRLAFEQTGSGWIPRIANAVLTPVFYILRLTNLALIWW
jgi:hypothetical protein